MASGRRGRLRTAPALENPVDFMYTLWEMAYAMWEQATVAHQMMDQLGRQPGAGHDGNPIGPEVDLEYLKFAEFQKANPRSFRWAFNLDNAEE